MLATCSSLIDEPYETVGVDVGSVAAARERIARKRGARREQGMVDDIKDYNERAAAANDRSTGRLSCPPVALVSHLSEHFE